MNNPADMEAGYEAHEAVASVPPEAPVVKREFEGKSLYDMFETDDGLETKGIIVDYGSAGKFLVARAGGSNTRYSKAVEALMRPHRRQFDLGTLDPEIALEVAREVFATTIILSWEGVRNRERELIPFTKENCIMVLTDLPEVFMDLQDFSSKAANFLIADLEGDSKN